MVKSSTGGGGILFGVMGRCGDCGGGGFLVGVSEPASLEVVEAGDGIDLSEGLVESDGLGFLETANELGGGAGFGEKAGERDALSVVEIPEFRVGGVHGGEVGEAEELA